MYRCIGQFLNVNDDSLSVPSNSDCVLLIFRTIELIKSVIGEENLMNGASMISVTRTQHLNEDQEPRHRYLEDRNTQPKDTQK